MQPRATFQVNRK